MLALRLESMLALAHLEKHKQLADRLIEVQWVVTFTVLL